MAKDKTLQYRYDGYIFALLFLMEHSLEDLEKEIELREKTGIKTILSFDEMNKDKGMLVMTGFVHEAQDVVWCMALRSLGFGKKRILRNYNQVRKRIPKTIQEAFIFRNENNAILHGIIKNKRYNNEDIPSLSRALQEYINYREEGLIRAAEVVRTQGLKELRKMITKTKYTESMVKKESDYANDVIRGIINEAKIMEWLIALHDNEGYADIRMNRVMDRFEKAYAKLQAHEEGFENYIDELEKVTGVRFSEEYLKNEPDYPKVHHKKKKKKPKKKKQKALEPVVELPPIEEPEEFTSYPCPGCPSKERCRAEGHQKECTCLALYKEVRKENLRRNIA